MIRLQQQERMFFYESGLGLSREAEAKMNRSFLVLFFKKEHAFKLQRQNAGASA
jgi:hypothetical protein